MDQASAHIENKQIVNALLASCISDDASLDVAIAINGIQQIIANIRDNFTAEFFQQYSHDMSSPLYALYLFQGTKKQSELTEQRIEICKRLRKTTLVLESLDHLSDLPTRGEVVEIKDWQAEMGELISGADFSSDTDCAALLHCGTIFVLLKNCVNNAYEHGLAGNVQVTISSDADHVYCTIEDDGNGVDTKELGTEWQTKIYQKGVSTGKGDRGRGLLEMPARLAEFGAAISIEPHGSSFNGRGARIVVKMRRVTPTS